MNYEEFEEMFTLSNEDIREITNEKMEEMGFEQMMDIIINMCESMDEANRESFKKATFIQRITYIARETYRYGFALALIVYSDNLKEQFHNIP